jgi:hypothetical protein
MQLNAPKKVTFWVALVVALVGLVLNFVPAPFLSGFAIWIVVLGFAILAAGNLLKGL